MAKVGINDNVIKDSKDVTIAEINNKFQGVSEITQNCKIVLMSYKDGKVSVAGLGCAISKYEEPDF